LKSRKTYHLYLSLVTALLFAINSNSQVVVPADDITQVEVAPAEDNESDEDQEIYNEKQDTLRQNYRSIVYDSVQAIATDKGFYYKRYLDSLLRATQPKPAAARQQSVNVRRGFSINSFFGVIFWIVAIGLFLYLVYRLFLSNASFLTRSRKNISPDITVTPDENTNEPDVLLKNAVRNGNYRLAIRYLYLQTLERLSERKYIKIYSNKTNYEYVNEVRKHGFGNEFASLTLKYEYVWYGEYPVDEKLFQQIQDGFVQFNKNYTRG
jgi:Domain of unknown function (DUF4129)